MGRGRPTPAAEEPSPVLGSTGAYKAEVKPKIGSAPVAAAKAGGTIAGDGAGPRILIVGGGIGGLTTALCLKQRVPAAHITIFEKADSISASGGLGINLLAPCIEVLFSLGLEVPLRETAIETSALILAGSHDEHIKTDPRGLAAGHTMPQLSIDRGQLARILSDAVVDRLGAEAVKADHRFQSFEERGDHVVARFAREGGGTTEFVGDALIGADGLHSAVRKLFYPHEQKRYTGWVSWRGLTPMASAPYDGRTMTIIGKVREDDGRVAASYGQAFVCYPIDEPTRKRGGALMNWVAEMAVEEVPSEEEGWLLPASKEEVAAAFAGFCFGPIVVASLISEATTCTKFVLYDRDPVQQWSFGRVTLLGDAAHPMLPFGSLGAGTAILDADALARALESETTSGTQGVPQALELYERARIESANDTVLKCRKGALHKPLTEACVRSSRRLSVIMFDGLNLDSDLDSDSDSDSN